MNRPKYHHAKFGVTTWILLCALPNGLLLSKGRPSCGIKELSWLGKEAIDRWAGSARLCVSRDTRRTMDCFRCADPAWPVGGEFRRSAVPASRGCNCLRNDSHGTHRTRGQKGRSKQDSMQRSIQWVNGAYQPCRRKLTRFARYPLSLTSLAAGPTRSKALALTLSDSSRSRTAGRDFERFC